MEKSATQKACAKAFGFAMQLSSGHDLFEEFIVANVWSLGQYTWKDFTLRIVDLSLYH